MTGAGTRQPEPVGTGRAAAILFAREGAKVLLVDIDAQNARATLEEIEREGGTASVFEADVSKADDCRALVAAAVERYGGLNILLNNVGVWGGGLVTEIDEAVWDRSLDVNLKGMAFTSKYAVPEIARSGGGSIINVSSVDGIRAGMTPNIPYTAAKGGIISMTRAMAVHHGREKVRVNCIAPGMIYAPIVGAISEEVRERRRKITPLGTEGTGWDIAMAAVFLASEESRWITGVVLPVDAGLLAAAPLAVMDNLAE